MIRSLAILGSVALGCAAAPAAAASEAFIAGAAAYEAGTESMMKPQEQAEFAYCAGYWTVWTEALDSETVPEEELEVLSPVLQAMSAAFQGMGWMTKLEESDTLTAEVDEGRNEASKFLKETLAGDVQSAKNLFGTLGACEL